MRAVDLSEPKSRRWPLAVALLALGSLGLLPTFLPSRERRERQADEDLAQARAQIEGGDPSGAERRLRSFLRGHDEARLPEGQRAMARLLLAEALLGRAGRDPFPGRPVVEEAYDLFDRARIAGAESVRSFDGQVRCARLLRDRGEFDGAAEMLDRVYRDSAEVSILLELARVRTRQAAKDPARRGVRLEEALRSVDEFLERTPAGEGRVPGLLERARVLWSRGRYAEMRDILDDALARHPGSRLVPEMRLERGKALRQLGSPETAIPDLTAAAASMTDPVLKDLARLHLVSVLARKHDPECQRIAELLIRSHSPFQAHVRILLGRYALETRRADPLPLLRQGLVDLSGPEVFEEERLDLEGVYENLRTQWEGGAEAEFLSETSAVIDEWMRLNPDRVETALDSAAVHSLAAAEFRKRGSERRRFGDVRTAEELQTRSAMHAYRCGEIHAGVARRGDVETDLVSGSLRRGAEAFFQGGWYVKAAEMYHQFYRYRPTSNHEGLYYEGVSYARAGIDQVPFADERDAVSTLGEYIRVSPPGSLLVPRALLERGRIHLRRARHADAAADFERILAQSDLGVGPRAWEWAEALRLLGVAELERALSLKTATPDPEKLSLIRAALRNAASALSQYVARYVDPAPGYLASTDPSSGEPGEGEKEGRSRALRTVFDLARVRLSAEEWTEAERTLRRVLEAARGSTGPLDAEGDDALRQSHFLLGEVLLALGRPAEAAAAFEVAYNRYVARPERLWGLLGQARAALQTRRLAEARQLHQRARELFDRNRATYAASLAGFGEGYWAGLLQDLERELQRAES